MISVFFGGVGFGGTDSLTAAEHLLGEGVGEDRGDGRVVDEVEVQHRHERRVPYGGRKALFWAGNASFI